MTVGEGVVGDGVLTGVGREVGNGVGAQVVQSKVTVESTPPVIKLLSKIVQICKPTGGVDVHLPVSSYIAYISSAVMTQYSSKAASSAQ